MLELYDAHPCGERSAQLIKDSQKNLQKSLAHLFLAAKEPLTHIFPSIKEKLRTMKKEACTSGFYHIINSFLFDSIEAEDIKAIKKLAQLFIRINESNGNIKFITYRNKNYSKSLWDIFDQVSLDQLPHGSVNFKPSNHDYTYTKESIQQCLNILKENIKGLWEEVSTLIKEIVILDSNRIIAGSSFKTLGLIYVKANPSLTMIDFLDLIVHEAAHQYIFHLSAIDPLCLNHPSELFKSPLRKDPRPLVGIYHATFVTARLVYLFKVLEMNQGDTGDPWDKVKEKISYYNERYQEGFKTSLQYGKLTALGEKLILSTQGITTL
jgi:hypothetical protein